MIDYQQLSNLTIISLIIAISFTILTFTGILMALNRESVIKKHLLRFILLFIFPFISLSVWGVTLCSITEVLKNEEGVSIIISMVVSLAIVSIIFLIAKSIENLSIKKSEAKKEPKKIPDVSTNKNLKNLKGLISDVIEPKTEVSKKIQERVLMPVQEEIKEVKELPKKEVIEIKNEEIKPTEIVSENQLTFEEIVDELVSQNTNKIEETKHEDVSEKKEDLKVILPSVIAEPKKRGRKPKIKTEEDLIKPEPKKRGRKPKIKTEEDLVKPEPKKRGRKPKTLPEIVISKEISEPTKINIEKATKVDLTATKVERINKTAIVPEEIDEESDFIKSLNELFNQIEQESKNNQSDDE